MTELDDLIHLTGYGIKVIHDSILESGSGLQGLKPGLSVEALVGRIHSNLFYQTFRSIEAVAALYAEVIAKGHVFNDGNKRTAVVSMLTFLDLNGYGLVVNENQLADKIVELSDGRTNYRQFALWLKPKIFEN